MPVVDTTQSFSTGDTVTSTTLNNIMDQSIFVAGAVVSASGLAITTGGQMTIADNGVPGSKITNGTITGGKIASNTITNANLENPSFTWASASNIGAIELGTNITTNGPSYIDFHSVFPLTDYEARIIRNSGADGTLEFANNGTGAFKFSSSGGVTFGNANMPNPVGTAPLWPIRAWGVISIASARTIFAGANVASVGKIDTTHTQVAFSTPMADASYVVSGCAKNDGDLEFATYDHQTTGFKIRHSTETAGRFVQFMVVR